MSLSATQRHFDAWRNRPWVRSRRKAIAAAESLGLSHATLHGLWSVPGHRDGYVKVARSYIATLIWAQRKRDQVVGKRTN